MQIPLILRGVCVHPDSKLRAMVNTSDCKAGGGSRVQSLPPTKTLWIPGDARSDQPCVPAVRDIVQHLRCILVRFHLLEPLHVSTCVTIRYALDMARG